MAPPLSVVPPAPENQAEGDVIIVTPRRLAPYVLKAFADAHRDGRRCTLDDLCDLIPVRRADLRKTVTALHHSDLLDAVRGRLTLRGFAVAIALAPRCEVPVREAIRGVKEPEARSKPCLEARPAAAKTA